MGMGMGSDRVHDEHHSHHVTGWLAAINPCGVCSTLTINRAMPQQLVGVDMHITQQLDESRHCMRSVQCSGNRGESQAGGWMQQAGHHHSAGFC